MLIESATIGATLIAGYFILLSHLKTKLNNLKKEEEEIKKKINESSLVLLQLKREEEILKRLNDKYG